MSEILADVQQFFDIEGELRQSQQNLLELEGMIRASSALAREFGSQIVMEGGRQELTSRSMRVQHA